MWFLLGMLLLIRVIFIVIKRDWGRLLSNIILLWFFFLFKYNCFIDLFVDDWVVDLGVVVVCFVVLLKIFLKSKWIMFIWFFEIYKYLKKKEFCRYMYKFRMRNVLYIYFYKWCLYFLYVYSYVVFKVCLNILIEMFCYYDI